MKGLFKGISGGGICLLFSRFIIQKVFNSKLSFFAILCHMGLTFVGDKWAFVI